MIVPQSTLAHEPQLKIERAGNKVTAVLTGPWTAEDGPVNRAVWIARLNSARAVWLPISSMPAKNSTSS